MWEAKVVATAVAADITDAVEMNWKHKVTPFWIDMEQKGCESSIHDLDIT